MQPALMHAVAFPATHLVSPREAALRIAEVLYAEQDAVPTDSRTFDLAGFQEDAVRRARRILRARGGVLIADSVGLGKTYVALALIEEALDGGGRVLVATPAALRRMWRAPLRRIAQSRGAIAAAGLGGRSGLGAPSGDDAGGDERATPATTLTWLSHARLSRGVDHGFPGRAVSEPTLVVVDEAHGFRNPRTRRYRELARLSLNAHVVLLTATPVNNTLLDLYALIRLFAADTDFRDLGVEDLRALFRTAALQPDAQLAPAMLGVLRAVMIRRTRPLLRESLRSSAQPNEAGSDATVSAGMPSTKAVRSPSGIRLRFPERAPPRILHYDLEATIPNLLTELAACLDALTFAPFRVHEYGVQRARPPASGAAELIRMMMLKRLESSVAALASSIDAQTAFVESFLEQLEGGRLLRPADHRATRSAHDSVQLLLGGVALDPLPRQLDARALRAGAAADIERLRTLRARLPPDPVSCDAKLARLCELIDGELVAERVLVFTEFRETARYLWTALRDRGGIALIHGGAAFLGRLRCGRRDVVERFAPAANGARPPPPREAVRVLIATDVLSEGMNLQDARHVVSYDLPWNPVRLIQRIGRIDRLGSTHDLVFAHTFIPQRGLDRLIGLLERIRMKLAAIHTGVGAETSLPRELTAPAVLQRLARADPRIIDEIELRDAAPFETEERLRSAYRRARPRTPEPATDTVRPVIAVQNEAGSPGGMLLAVRAGNAVRLALRTEAGRMLVDSPVAFELLTAMIDGVDHGHTTPSSDTPPIEPDHDAIAGAVRWLSELLAKRFGGTAVSPSAPRQRRTTRAHAWSRRLLDALARVPGGPDARLCARAEKLLTALARGGPAGLDHALAALPADIAMTESAANLCDRLEMLLAASTAGREATATAAAPAGTRDIELIGAIELRLD